MNTIYDTRVQHDFCFQNQGEMSFEVPTRTRASYDLVEFSCSTNINEKNMLEYRIFSKYN